MKDKNAAQNGNEARQPAEAPRAQADWSPPKVHRLDVVKDTAAAGAGAIDPLIGS